MTHPENNNPPEIAHSPWDELREASLVPYDHPLSQVPTDMHELLAANAAHSPVGEEVPSEALSHEVQPAGVLKVELDEGNSLRMKTEPQPMGVRVVQNEEGKTEVPVAAYVQLTPGNKKGKTVLLSPMYNDEGALESFNVYKVKQSAGNVYVQEGKAENIPADAPRSIISEEPGQNVVLSYADRKKPGWKLEVEGPYSAKATVSEASSPVYHDRNAKEARRDTAKRWARKVGAVALAYSVFSSGGLLDRGLDIANNPVQTVRDHYAGSKGDIFNPKNNSDLQVIARGVSTEGVVQPDEQREQTATKNIERIVKDLDGHNYDAIRKRAAVFEAQHAGELVSEETINKANEAINQATTNEEVRQALGDYMRFYGKTVAFANEEVSDYQSKFDPHTPVETTQKMAKAIVTAFEPLPKPMLEPAFATLLLTGGNAKDGGFYEAGQDPATEGVIALSVESNAFSRALDTLDNSARFSFNFANPAVHIVLHEVGHAMFRNGAYDGESTTEGRGMAALPEHALRYVAMRPKDASLYAATADSREGEAEAWRSTFGNLASPEAARMFSSEANLRVWDVLRAMDIAMPGYADYVVAKANKQLFRSYVAVGRFDPLS